MKSANQDDLPSQPVNTQSSTHDKHDAPAPGSQPPVQAQAPERPDGMYQNSPEVQYDSNPFSITFSNFSKMFKHAQAVAILMVVFGVIGSLGNVPSFDTPDFEELRNESEFSLVETTKAQDNAEEPLMNDDFFNELDPTTSDPLQNEIDNSDVGAAIGAVLAIVIIVVLVVFAISLVVGTIWSGLVAAAANMAVRDRDISFGEAFSQSIKRFGTMFVALFIAGVKIIGGYLLFIIPGIRAQARYAALPYVVMGNPSMSAGQAVSETKKLYDGHLMESFSIVWVSGIIPFIGNILGAVGLAQSARQISDYKSKGLPKPQMSGWNWVAPIVLGFVLVIVIIALIALTAFVASEI